jgi:NAD(P)-dependent dehydrogenase (short-subunit alcohol dehydrogenase family)
MDLELKGKRALVTGGTKGIGRAIARQLAAEGARVIISGRDESLAARAASELRSESGGNVTGTALDTGEDSSVSDMAARTLAELGSIDILVNNAARRAGSTAPPALADSTSSMFWDDINVKVMGYIRVSRAFAPSMKAQGWGRIINVGGLAARQAYSAIWSIRNASITALTKNLADELGPFGINVSAIHPGSTRTEATADIIKRRAEAAGKTAAVIEAGLASNTLIGRIVDASEIAYVVAFLASPKSVAIAGDAIPVGGGFRGPIYY